MTDLIKTSCHERIFEIVLNKPTRRNALCQKMWMAVKQAIDTAKDDPTAVVIMIHGGTAGAFAAGADISEFAEIYATPESARTSSNRIGDAVHAIETCPKPVIAAIDGACVGGGVSMAVACDLRFATSRSRFGVTPGKLGLVYSPADTRRLVRTIGAARTKDLLFSGRLIDADEALRFGLIDTLVPDGDVVDAARKWALAVTANAHSSVYTSKEMIRGISNGLDDGNEHANDIFLNALLGEDFREGYQAFLQKRPPHFPGNIVRSRSAKGD